MPGEPSNEKGDDFGLGNQSDISLFANKFFGGTDIGEVISKINWPLNLTSRAKSQEPKETQGEWTVVYAAIDEKGGFKPGKANLHLFDIGDGKDALEKGKQIIKELEKQNYKFREADIAYVLKKI